jgi:hypothetical protein
LPSPTYTPLANVTLSSSASSVTFSSIPATYRDLVLVVEATSTSLAYGKLEINSDTGSNYSYVLMQGNGSAAASGSVGGVASGYFSPYDNPRFSTTAHLSITQIMDYAQTNKHKTWISRGNRAADGVGAVAGRWASTNAITQIKLSPTSGNWASGSTFALYGIIA